MVGRGVVEGMVGRRVVDEGVGGMVGRGAAMTMVCLPREEGTPCLPMLMRP